MEIRAPENTTRCLLWARTWQKQGGFQSLKDMAHGNHWEILHIWSRALFSAFRIADPAGRFFGLPPILTTP
ncbi:hypothetical protein [Tardiphaga sp. 839_C3_N1_4]|jgi:hypothetical protein|uniref:hypothetical protein n=1 Tax=Tardiphaga sp. 839_C3_N1_4 TaxID=3240761 RepID=UPI003F257360